MSEVVRPLPGAYAYAPELVVEARGRELAAPVLNDVIEARVTLQEDEPAGFTLVLANADPGKRGLSRSDEVTPFKYTDRALLDVETPITIKLGYAGRTRRMVVGEVVSFSPTFPQGGLSTLTIAGNDFFQRLRNAKPSSDEERAHHGVADWQIAEAIAHRHKLDLSKEFERSGPVHEIVNQGAEEDDLTFLLKRAKLNGFVCFISLEEGDARPKLHFTRPADLRNDRDTEVFEYRWGESLLSFSPKLSTRGLVKKVTVRAWNPRKKDFFEYSAELKDLPRTGGNGRAGAEVIADKDAKEKRIVTRAVLSAEEAKRIAIGVLEENARGFITGSGEIMGDPDLRPGVVLRLAGLGRRFSGDYVLRKTDHVFSSAGYVTSFEVDRYREGERPSDS